MTHIRMLYYDNMANHRVTHGISSTQLETSIQTRGNWGDGLGWAGKKDRWGVGRSGNRREGEGRAETKSWVAGCNQGVIDDGVGGRPLEKED